MIVYCHIWDELILLDERHYLTKEIVREMVASGEWTYIGKL